MEIPLDHSAVNADEKAKLFVNLVLAPNHSSLKPKACHPDLHCRHKFRMALTRGIYGSAAQAARTFVEDLLSNAFLAAIANRCLESYATTSTAIEIIYGAGFRTVIKRKAVTEIKSLKQIGVYLSLGKCDCNENIESLPLILPTDDLWDHAVLFAELYSDVSPTLFVRTSEILLVFPEILERKSSISLEVQSKKGFWSGITREEERTPYPVLPIWLFPSQKRKQFDSESAESTCAIRKKTKNMLSDKSPAVDLVKPADEPPQR